MPLPEADGLAALAAAATAVSSFLSAPDCALALALANFSDSSRVSFKNCRRNFARSLSVCCFANTASVFAARSSFSVEIASGVKAAAMSASAADASAQVDPPAEQRSPAKQSRRRAKSA